jgi:hypothetical protein
MDVDAGEILAEIQTLSTKEPANTLPRLRELADAAEQMAAGRYSKAGLAAALTHQAIHYLIEGIEREQYGAPEIKRRFAIAVSRTEAWAREQSPAFRPADES